ncbi:uncharacterized protein LOC109800563 [Cajanus cajan]|uniref:uncharacterized protein LOC109800563 n=1 Tax=Cajanus cajan TaxID=3821 RepID=UPI00098DAFC6|nr:uncharacterized protein LOC109800563 [Cajanus cajan]
MASKNLKLRDLFSESGKIFKAHSRHFHTLTLIFLFPLSFLFLFLLPLNFNHSFTKPSSTTNHQPFFHLLYSLFLSILSYSGVISITNSVFHFFYDQPVNLLSAINSISTSFLPLLATTVVSHVIFFFISLFYGLLLLLLISGATLFSVTIPHSFPPYLIAFGESASEKVVEANNPVVKSRTIGETPQKCRREAERPISVVNLETIVAAEAGKGDAEVQSAERTLSDCLGENWEPVNYEDNHGVASFWDEKFNHSAHIRGTDLLEGD